MSRGLGAALRGGLAKLEPSAATLALPPPSRLRVRFYDARPRHPRNVLRKRLALAKFGMAGLFAGLSVLVMTTM